MTAASAAAQPSPNGQGPTSPAVDLYAVGLVRSRVREILDRRSEREELTRSQEEALAPSLIREQLDVLAEEAVTAQREPLDAERRSAVQRRVRADLFGLGGFEELIADESVENIFANGAEDVFVTRAGGDGSERVDPIASSDDELIELVRRWASELGRTDRRFDPANPRLDLQLPGGQRLHAIMTVTQRPTVTIRCPARRKIGLREQLDYGTIDEKMLLFLVFAVRAKCNIIVSGGTGTGKTTLLRSLLFNTAENERVIIIEDTTELRLAQYQDEHPNVVEMETRQANADGRGEITMLELTRECLRMSPDRVIVGEVRGAEALYMLKAMSQGNDGSMCSIHAESARGVADRVRGYCAEGLAGIPLDVIDSFYRNAVHLVLQIRVVVGPDGTAKRRVTNIVEVPTGRPGQERYRDLFGPSHDGVGGIDDSPDQPSDELLARLKAAGYPGWQA